MKFLLSSCCFVFIALSTWAQTKNVTGQIIGPDKEPVIGAAILEKGTNNGTQTDIDGNFAIAVKDSGNPVLVVSYVGLKSKEIPVAGQSNITTTMEDDAKVTEEVVVVGYGTVKKSDLTGAVVSLKPDDVKQVPSSNVMESIQGKAAGVDVTRPTGEAGKSPTIVVRGNRSIAAGNEPLYVVDGIQYSSIGDINPNDIQSMEILKDASSTAIYGSRGSNGVVIITTKKGASGEMKVSVNGYYGVSTPAKTGFSKTNAFPEAMNAEQYAQFKRELYRTNNGAYGTDQQALQDEYNGYVAGNNRNYVDDLLHNGLQRDISVGISGGTDKLKSYFSLEYFNEKGLLKEDEMKRYSGRLNLDYQVKKYLKVGANIQVTNYDQSRRVNPLGNAMKVSPLASGYDANGNIDPKPFGKHANPMLDEQPNTAVRNYGQLRIFPTVFVNIDILKNLKFTNNFSMNWDNRSDGTFYSSNSYTVQNNPSAPQANQAGHITDSRTQLNWQGILNYNKTLFKDLEANATLISEVIKNKTEEFGVYSYGQLIPEQLYYNLNDGNSSAKYSTYTKRDLVSFAGRLNLSYKNRYLLSATGRSDGASVLAEDKKWDFFPSVAGAWKLTEEKFLSRQNLFSTIKLRASYGISGNSTINPYSTQSLLTKTPFTFDEMPVTAYTYSNRIGNVLTTWEKTKTWDIGVDLGVWKERVTLTFDYYNSKTTGLLLDQVLPPSTGVGVTTANTGSVLNKGIELGLSSVNITTKNFTWSTTITFQRNKEKVTELVAGQDKMQVTPNGSTATQWEVVGSPVQIIYDYQKDGIWQLGEEEAAKRFGRKPGDIKIADVNGDGKISPEDRVVIGQKAPKWSAGFNSVMRYKGFDFTFFLIARVGQTIDYQYAYSQETFTNSMSTRDYWTPENATNDLPRPGQIYGADPWNNTINYVDGSFLKLRTIGLGYTLPKSFTEKLSIGKLRVYVQAKNALVFTKVKNYDTEMDGAITFPSTRLFLGGFDLEF